MAFKPGAVVKISANDAMLSGGLVLLFAGLAGLAGWALAAAVTGTFMAAIAIANSYLVTWLSTKAKS